MIQVDRLDPPPYLTRYAQRWTDELLAVIQEAEQTGTQPSEHLWNKYNKPYIKDALQIMFHGKCAYCESKIAHIDYPHIEHYRPKRRYPRFTFKWDNLLLACPKCNGKEYKGDKFPLNNDDENDPLLFNPCNDDPTEHFLFEQARLVPLSERGAVIRDLLGLNRDDLFDRRRNLLLSIDYIRRIVEDYESDGNEIMAQQGRSLLDAANLAEAEYTAMVRQFMANPLPQRPPL